MGCLCCGAEDREALCRTCTLQIQPADGVISEHVHSTIDTTDAVAWVVDGFGGAHGIGESNRIGRNYDSQLILLASSVSREHAELRRVDGAWTLRDLKSRNGTSVNGEIISAPVTLPPRAVLKFGDVGLWFLAEVLHEPPPPSAMKTAGRKRGPVRYLLERGGTELCLAISDDVVAAGTLLWRPVGTSTWSERTLAPLEFQLLRVLVIRAHEDSSAISSIRGCVSSKQLVAELPFQSKYANQENVRQVVLRLRGVLAELGVAGMLGFAPGRGYYLSCLVQQAGATD